MSGFDARDPPDIDLGVTFVDRCDTPSQASQDALVVAVTLDGKYSWSKHNWFLRKHAQRTTYCRSR